MTNTKKRNPNTNAVHASRAYLGKRRQGIAIGTLALVIVLVLVASYGIIQLTERRAHAAAEKLVSEVVSHIDDKMNEVKLATREISKSANVLLDKPDDLTQLVHDFVEKNTFVYGSTVAFEPDYFPDLGRCFAPYSWVTPDGEVHSRQLGTETDYYEEEWYAETKESGEEYWCEPYFDEGGAKIMMCTFSVPLKDSSGNLVAVMTADVGLQDLEEYVSSIIPTPDSFIMLRSRQGNPLVNEGKDSSVRNGIIIKGMTEIGWSVELSLPFTYLMHGDTGIFFFIGLIVLVTFLFVYFINRLFTNLQQRSTEEYMNVIDSISSSFSSIYLVDLLTDESVVFRDPEKYSRITGTTEGAETAFTLLMEKLINFDCYTADCELMLKETSLETIRERLSSQERYEVRFRKEHDGEISWHEMHVFVMERGPENGPVRAVIAFTNVNESVQKEKEAQDALEQALEMAESASRAKSSFLFNMSHDIRTPMNAIIGFTNMALKHIDDQDRVKDSLTKMQESGELLLSLINDILDMSRIESGSIKLDENEGDVYLSFANIESTMRDLAESKNIDLRFEFGNITDRYVYSDSSRCTRVFVNIISNAIKYTNKGGTVTVGCTQIGEKDGCGIYRYTFADNGIGMSEEFQQHVFDEFAREESATVSGIQGTGLGLAVCRSFVTAMNGTIECQSKQGEGSTFIVTLPFRIQTGTVYKDPVSGRMVSRDIAETEAEKVDFAGKKVLLVEDNELNREIAEDILSEGGMLVESADDGSVAVQIMREKGPDYFDFILMDIQMPIMDGYEATRAIRDMYPKASVPIIALSANAFEEDKIKSLSAGMNAHIAKPINVDVLNSTLAKFL